MTRLLKPISVALIMLLLVAGQSFAQTPADFKLPQDAIKISDTVPAMGEHWANPRNLPLGPIYLVSEGKVIGVEYMFTLAMMKKFVAPTPAGEEVMFNIDNLSLFGQKYDHMTVAYMANGHNGFEVPHYDVHLYFISPADRYKIILNAPAPRAASVLPSADKAADAVQVSPVIPAMGEHWANPAHLPFGPIYLVNKGKTVGVEYMFNHDPLACQQIPEGPGRMIWVCGIENIPLGRTLDHMTLTYLPKGHDGYTVWHFDVHLYNIPSDERAKIAP